MFIFFCYWIIAGETILLPAILPPSIRNWLRVLLGVFKKLLMEPGVATSCSNRCLEGAIRNTAEMGLIEGQGTIFGRARPTGTSTSGAFEAKEWPKLRMLSSAGVISKTFWPLFYFGKSKCVWPGANDGAVPRGSLGYAYPCFMLSD